MLKAGVGISSGEDSHAVASGAAQAAITELGEAKAGLVIVFASTQYDQEEMLKGVRSVVPDTLIVGSSTAGEITTEGPARKHSVAVMALWSNDIKFYAGVGENIAKDAVNAGKIAAESVKGQTSEPLKFFAMLPDVLVGNGADIVRGALQSLGDHFPLVGGASGDDFKFEKTYQYLNDRVYSGAVVGFGMTGNIKMGVGVKHGWIPVGLPRKVTKSEGAVLHELDGKPALSIYEEHFGKEGTEELKNTTLAKIAITYPLGMTVPGSDEMLIRDPLTVNEYGSITCAAEIPEGADIRLMIGSREEAVKVAEEAAQNALAQLEGAKPKAILIFNCIARNKLFGEQKGDEIEVIQNVLGQQTPLLGFYTYGEQAPLGGEVKNIEKCNPAFHNETVVVTVLGE